MSVAIITGASSGIGREFAQRLSEKKDIDEVWIIARRLDRLEALQAELKDVKVKIITADLSTEEGIDKIREALASHRGALLPVRQSARQRHYQDESLPHAGF